jgi:site-specific recombinase XerD
MADRAELSPAAARELAQAMLLGHHSVSFTAAHTGLAEARVEALARTLHAAKRIPRVRA